MSAETKVFDVKPTTPKIHFIPDVVYAQMPTFASPNELLQADILLPQLARRMPAVIFVTGGAFIAANRARLPQLRFRLAQAGYVVASINYRTVPNGHFPDPIEDVKSAIRFVKANARRLLVDPDRITVIGDSAGGYLAAFAAATNASKQFNVGEHLEQSSGIIGAVSLYGLVDPNLLDVGFVLPNTTLAVNPIEYITKDSAPMLLMHGTADQLVPPSETEKLFRALIKNGVEAERYLIQGAGHADEYWVQSEVIDLIVAWIDRRAKS